MTISATVVLDSLAPNGARLTTFELTYPRFIHSELMTHRVFSRNAASSRAIPTHKKIERIRKDMAKPSEWGVNQKGMQSGGALDPAVAERADALWSGLGEEACKIAEILDEMGLHKQVANRLIEPWDHITTVVSTTKLNNHWKLRLEIDPVTGRPMPDPTYFELATKWKAAFDASVPFPCEPGGWHLPYANTKEDWQAVNDYLVNLLSGITHAPISREDILPILRKVSVGRVARTSYMRQGQGDIEENVKLHDRLAGAGHWSPFEPIATPIDGIEFIKSVLPCSFCMAMKDDKRVRLHLVNHDRNIWYPLICQKCGLGHVTSGNYVGWHQYRKDFPNESGGD